MRLDRQLVRDIIAWDVATWSKALALWNEVISFRRESPTALELGAGCGGLSLYLALQGYEVTCSDIGDPQPKAHPLHSRYSVANHVSYKIINATSIDLPNSSVDVIAFKSLLAVVAKDDGRSSQRMVLRECLRVLKPNGHLLFAENLVATSMHMFLRRRFVKWGSYCYYPSLIELEEYLAPFSEIHLETTGFFATLGRSELQRSCLHLIDAVIEPLVDETSRYLAVGWAQK